MLMQGWEKKTRSLTDIRVKIYFYSIFRIFEWNLCCIYSSIRPFREWNELWEEKIERFPKRHFSSKHICCSAYIKILSNPNDKGNFTSHSRFSPNTNNKHTRNYADNCRADQKNPINFAVLLWNTRDVLVSFRHLTLIGQSFWKL